MFDFFRTRGAGNLDAAVEGTFVAFGFAAAQVRFADVRPHHFAGRGNFKPLGCRFVSF